MLSSFEGAASGRRSLRGSRALASRFHRKSVGKLFCLRERRISPDYGISARPLVMHVNERNGTGRRITGKSVAKVRAPFRLNEPRPVLFSDTPRKDDPLLRPPVRPAGAVRAVAAQTPPQGASGGPPRLRSCMSRDSSASSRGSGQFWPLSIWPIVIAGSLDQ